MHFVFPLLVFFVLLLASTLHTEPLLVLGRGRDHPNTWPMVPVIAVITADHGTAVIRLVATRTDPDLVPQLITNHVCSDSFSDHTAYRQFAGGQNGGGGEQRGYNWGQ